MKWESNTTAEEKQRTFVEYFTIDRHHAKDFRHIIYVNSNNKLRWKLSLKELKYSA